MLTLLGIFLALAVSGTLPVWAALLPVMVCLVVLAVWRFTSVATVAGLLTFTLITAALPLGPTVALILLLTATWRLKEQLGRVGAL